MSRLDYPLIRDSAEHARLAAQAAFWAPEAAALIDPLGLPRGASVADLGCGTLQVCELLARAVGRRGRVLGLDSDAALVAAMQGATRHAALVAAMQGATRHAAIEVQRGDAFATGWAAGSLQAVHARFLAAPAGRLPALVAEMRRLLPPGGMALLQEPDADSWDLTGGGADWQRLLGLIRAGFQARGGDFDAGRELPGALQAAGFVDVQQRRIVRHLPAGHPYAALPLAFARQLRPLWLDEGLVDEPELAALLHAIERRLAEGAEATSFTLVQCWGRRGA
jgi:SAM-dependent methyltransferase